MTGTPQLLTQMPPAALIDDRCESDAAFSRAFKRTLGVPPAAWRNKSRETAARRTA